MNSTGPCLGFKGSRFARSALTATTAPLSDAEKFRGAAFYFFPRKDARIQLQHEISAGSRGFVEQPLA